MYDSLAAETQESAVVRRFASILILLLIAPLSNYAQSICEAYQSDYNASIFRGYVSDVTVDQSACVGQMYCNQELRVQTLEVFKGNPGREIILQNNHPLMEKGHEYLIYAQAPRDDGDVYAHGEEIKDVSPETLAWLRAYPTAPQTARIYGEVYYVPSTLDASHILITLTENGNQSHTLTTAPTAPTAPNDEFTYSFNNLPPGIYTVSASVPSASGLLIESTLMGAAYDGHGTFNQTSSALNQNPTGTSPKLNEIVVSVAPKRCGKIDFTIRYDSHIKGRVTDTSGHPVAGASVGLIMGGRESDLARGRIHFVAQMKTDADGVYDFTRLDPDDYRVGLHPFLPSENDPYPPVFYPAKSMPLDAAVLHLEASATIDNIDFVRPDALPPATVHVLFVHKDGSPIESNNIQIVDRVISGIVSSVETDATGHADVHLFAGREYTLIAVTQEPHPSCAGPVEFIAKDGLTLATLIADKTFQACTHAPRPALNSPSAP
jgi:hypothetical protein